MGLYLWEEGETVSSLEQQSTGVYVETLKRCRCWKCFFTVLKKD